MSLHSGFGLNGHYDETGHWQRTKFCFMYCGQRCDCGPPGGLHYSAAHDKRESKGITPALPEWNSPAWFALSDEIEASPPRGALHVSPGEVEYASWFPISPRGVAGTDIGNPISPAPSNPYAGKGSMAEAWQRGYEGRPMLAALGSDYARAYGEGKKAAAVVGVTDHETFSPSIPNEK